MISRQGLTTSCTINKVFYFFPKVPVETESTVFVAVPHSVDSACQTEACETKSTLEDSFLDQQSISDESDVILALGLSREDSECDSDFYSDSEFD